MTTTHPIWAILTCVVAVSPFWFMAASLDDGSEAIATAIGAGLAGTVTIVLKHFGKVTCERCKQAVTP